jgi:opacity protein-like surface antigen
MKKKLLIAMCLAALTAATLATAAYDSGPFAGRGVVRAIRWMDRLVVLENEHGIEFLNLDDNASVQDHSGAAITLRDLTLGAEVEYTGRYWEGLNFAHTLRISPRPLVISAR